MPSLRTVASLATAALLLSGLAACSDDKPEKSGPVTPVSYADQVVYADGATIYFDAGKKPVDVGRQITFVYYSTVGMVLEVVPKDAGDPGARLQEHVLVRADGTITDLDLPENIYVATDPTTQYLAWTSVLEPDGKVVVVDLATGKQVAEVAVDTQGVELTQLTLDGTTVWLHEPEQKGAYRIDWKAGTVDEVAVDYLRWIRGTYAVTAGGNEIAREAGSASPGVRTLESPDLLLEGDSWRLSPTGTSAGRDVDPDNSAETTDGTITIAPLPGGDPVVFPVTMGPGNYVEWTWTADATKVFWFEGTELHVCLVATKSCSTSTTKAENPRVPITGL